MHVNLLFYSSNLALKARDLSKIIATHNDFADSENPASPSGPKKTGILTYIKPG